MKVTRRQLAHMLAVDRRTPPIIWPCVQRGGYAGLQCLGDRRRAVMQTGAVTPRTKNEALRAKRAAKDAAKSESARLLAWVTDNLKAIPKTFLITDIVPLISADVFAAESDAARRVLMITRALKRSGFMLSAKDSRTSVWLRRTDLATATRITRNGRRLLVEVPDSLRAPRRKACERQRVWKAKHRVAPIAPVVVGRHREAIAPAAIRAVRLPQDCRRRWS